MSKSFTGDHALAELTEGQTAHAALDSNTLTNDANNLTPTQSGFSSPEKTKIRTRSRSRSRQKTKRRTPAHAVRQRFGLPDNFAPRLQRYGRSVLLEQNIYSLPNEVEYLPTHPVGTLGSRQHLYALLTVEQYLAQKRGSVYVRNDGRIFDYSVDHGNSEGDIFDTGYTIYDLERTGRYAPQLTSRRKQREAAKARTVASG